MFGVCSLASGSKGNATLIMSDKNSVLIDCGLSCKKLLEKFVEIGFDTQRLSAIFVSHEHSDHISGIRVVAKKLGVPVYANVMTSQMLQSKGRAAEEMTVFENGNQIAIGELVVEPFSVPHDAVDTVAYCVYKGDQKITVATDFGFPSQAVQQKLKKSDILLLESNYDHDMLLDSERPWKLMQRIMGKHGHLSNEQTLEVMDGVLHENMRYLILGHVSEHANEYGLVRQLAEKKLAEMNLTDKIELVVALQNTPSKIFWL